MKIVDNPIITHVSAFVVSVMIVTEVAQRALTVGSCGVSEKYVEFHETSSKLCNNSTCPYIHVW